MADNDNKDKDQEHELLEDDDALKMWITKKFMPSMDKYAFARAFFLFSLLGFYLGNNLMIFLWLYSIIYIYLFIYRIVRFWANDWLPYVFEFCYFGNFSLIAFIFFLGDSESYFKIPYVCSTGVMSLAIIVFNNQANFNSSDHITSTYLHALPMIACWAIRWKHYIYYSNFNKGYGLEIMSVSPLLSFKFDAYFWEIVYLPYILWIGWVLIYILLVYTCMRNQFTNIKYGSGLKDFTKMNFVKPIFGDLMKNSLPKYIALHFINFIVTSLFSFLSYYNFYFNTVYLFVLIAFLGYNTSKGNARAMEKQLIKAGRKSIMERRATLNKQGTQESLKKFAEDNVNQENNKDEIDVSHNSDNKSHKSNDIIEMAKKEAYGIS